MNNFAVALQQSGDSDVMTALRQLQYDTLSQRVNERLIQLHKQITLINDSRPGRDKRKHKWKHVQKLASRGERIATTFKRDSDTKIFSGVHATVSRYLSDHYPE